VRDTAVVVLLFVGVVVQVLGCLGVIRMRTALDRLHFTGFGVLGAVGVAAAVTVREGFSLVADKGITVAVIVLVTSPVIVQVVASAARTLDRGHLDAAGDDVERVE
jgi:monovalent cation/proton antiporter MnhG/PhaG subunit